MRKSSKGLCTRLDRSQHIILDSCMAVLGVWQGLSGLAPIATCISTPSVFGLLPIKLLRGKHITLLNLL